VSKAKETMGRLMEAIEAGDKPEWARKTIFLPRDDGSLLRRITRRDGTIEREDIIPAERCFPLAARAKTGLSQSQFATLLGISVRTLHDWEQGRREPSGAAMTLLKIASRHPEVLREVMNDA
jgi:hypothetical protein